MPDCKTKKNKKTKSNNIVMLTIDVNKDAKAPFPITEQNPEAATMELTKSAAASTTTLTNDASQQQ